MTELLFYHLQRQPIERVLPTLIEKSLERAAKDEIREIDLLQEILHDDLAAFVYDKIRRRPMVLPVVVEV